jgi:hypothetical protein
VHGVGSIVFIFSKTIDELKEPACLKAERIVD